MQFLVSLKQVVIIFILMIIGFICKKADFIHEITVKDLTNLLLYVVSPCLIINSFIMPFSQKQFKMFLLALGVSILVFIINILLADLFFQRKHFKNHQQLVILRYSTVYSNAGFMGIPLVQVFLGTRGVFFSTPFLIVYNLLMWSHGIHLFKNNHDNILTQLKKLLINLNIIAAIVGMVIYLLQFKLPVIIHMPMHYLASVNTPLSMIVIGSNLSQISLREIFNDRLCWLGTLVRNIIVPCCTLMVLQLFALNNLARMAIIIMISCPVAGVVVLFSILNNYDTKFPIKLLCLSTSCAVITIPLLIWLAMLI